MKSFGYGESMVAKWIQGEGGHSKAKFHGSVQIFRGSLPYLKGVEIPFNINIFLFRNFSSV